LKFKRPERMIDRTDWRRHMNHRLRAEWIAGADEEWRRRTGRPMTAEARAGDAAVSGGRVNPRSEVRGGR
jgi:hypothetical protein